MVSITMSLPLPLVTRFTDEAALQGVTVEALIRAVLAERSIPRPVPPEPKVRKVKASEAPAALPAAAPAPPIPSQLVKPTAEVERLVSSGLLPDLGSHPNLARTRVELHARRTAPPPAELGVVDAVDDELAAIVRPKHGWPANVYFQNFTTADARLVEALKRERQLRARQGGRS